MLKKPSVLQNQLDNCCSTASRIRPAPIIFQIKRILTRKGWWENLSQMQHKRVKRGNNPTDAERQGGGNTV